MNTKRPKINVPWEPLDIIIDLLSITLFILMIVYTVINYGQLSEMIPTHFNSSGEADGFGDKYQIWLLPMLGIFLFILLFVLNRYPHLHNYMVNITEDNALKNYRFSTRIVRFTNLFMAILFVIIQYVMIEQGKGNKISLSGWFLPLVIGLSVVLPIFVLIYYRKINKS